MPKIHVMVLDVVAKKATRDGCCTRVVMVIRLIKIANRPVVETVIMHSAMVIVIAKRIQSLDPSSITLP